MVNKMHPNESFVKAKTPYAKFDQLDLHIEKVLSELIIVGKNIYHMYTSMLLNVKHLVKVLF